MRQNADSILLTVKRSFKSAVFRFALGLLICFLAGWGVHRMLLERHLDELRASTAQRLEFYRLSLEATLDRNESLPYLIALDERLATLLVQQGDSERQVADDFLRKVKERADIAATYLMDDTGLTIASSNAGQPGFVLSGKITRIRPYFKEAMQGELGRFYGIGSTTGEPGYFLAAPIKTKGNTVGAVAVKVSLDSFETPHGGRVGTSFCWLTHQGSSFFPRNDEWKYKTLRPLNEDDQRRTARLPAVWQRKAETVGD